MPVKVSVKWGKQKYDDVEVNNEEPPELLKAQIFALSGVPPDRQKLMVKGKTIQDESWGDVKLADGATIMMMGSTEIIPVGPPVKAKTDKDDEDDQMAQIPLGLANLGNTCYLNATLQCFRKVPELRQALKGFQGSLVGFNSEVAKTQSVTAAVKTLYDDMDRFPQRIIPMVMVQSLRSAYPRFAEMVSSEDGQQRGFAQQDANEAWTELLNNLKHQLPALPALEDEELISPPTSGVPQDVKSAYSNAIEQFMGGEMSVTMKCKESETEPAATFSEKFLQLSCFITQDTKYVQSGLTSRLKETITKRAETLGRDAEFEKICKLTRLPGYLTVQLMRFFFKERARVGAKILKDIKFQLRLDVFDLCSEELQQKLIPNRNKFKEMEDAELERKIKAVKNTNITYKEFQSSLETGKKPESLKAHEAAALEAAKAAPSIDTGKYLPYWFEDDVGSNNSGYYDLQAVLTHQGRTSNSGHYVAWVRQEENVWFKFDDEKVSVVDLEEILKLSGGGDWHCAYLLLYGPRRLQVPPPKPVETEAPKTSAMDADMSVD